MVEILKKNETILRVELLEVTKDSLKISEHNKGIYWLPIGDVSHITPIDTLRKRYEWFDLPNTDHYLFLSNAFLPERHSVTFLNRYIFVNSINVGVSRRISIGSGTTILTKSAYYLTTKFSLIERYNYKIAAGIAYFRLPSNFITSITSGSEVRDVGWLFCVASHGNHNYNASVGVGYFIKGAAKIPTLFTFGGAARISRHFAFNGEAISVLHSPASFSSTKRTPVIVPVQYMTGLSVRYNLPQSSFNLGLYFVNDFRIKIPYISYSLKFAFPN